MNPHRTVTVTNRTLPRLLLIGALLALVTGCVYRPNIQQGNLLKTTDVDQVTVGMTRSQVRYVLGTPMISDPFTPERWDYVYTLQRGHQSRIDRAHFIVHFDGDRVSKIEKPDLPDAVETAEAGKAPTREPPPLPSIKQGQPDTPRPTGTH